MSSQAMKLLEAAGSRTRWRSGIHDTEATGVGGGARDRNTRIAAAGHHDFNATSTPVATAECRVRSRRTRSTTSTPLTAPAARSGWSWCLRLWPRKSVVDWAKNVVASHPDYNVIVVDPRLPRAATAASSRVPTTATPARRHLFDQPGEPVQPTSRWSFSGHVGVAASRVDTGVHGNKIYDFMTTIHSATTNPVRMFTIDTAPARSRPGSTAPSRI